ncbi:MAG TPA: glycosyltransferase family 2 protein [Bryobacteraceae bacterium]|nr:glycosyltransferase family 2 protein [Bryobacteraceae bacterium]
MQDVGIVVVAYHSAAEMGPCLDAALATGAEIVVVDNSSCEETAQQVLGRGVRLIRNQVNKGFAGAVNQGIRSLSTPYILLLNPDAVIKNGLDALLAACKRPGVAAAGGMLVDSRGLPQAGFMVRCFPTPAALAFEVLLINRLWPGNPVNWQYRCLGLDCAAPSEVEQPAGAFLMIRRDAWETLGGFDERYHPVWFEDVDFCRRAVAHGYRIWFVPSAVAKHTGGHSVSKIGVEKKPLYWYGNLLRYAAVHYGLAGRAVVCLAVVTGSTLRMMAELVLSRSLKPIAVYGRVMALAAGYLLRGVPGEVRRES